MFVKIYAMTLHGKQSKFLPWNQILSGDESEKFKEARGDRRACTEMELLHKMMWDDTKPRT